jgi:octaprenyl-diphosphate synthase
MDPAIALDHLRQAGTSARAGDVAVRRLADAHALLAEDMAKVDETLRMVVRDGLAPATDSAKHLLEAGGKRVRPLSLLLSAACFGPVPPAARELAVAAELVHLATLLHDDVIDDGLERRGRAASRTLWGNAVSVLAGDLLLTHALSCARKVAVPGVLEELLATLRRLVDGEVVQLRGRTVLDTRRSTYFQVVGDKTAALFAWATRAGAMTAGAERPLIDAIGRFGTHIGLAFQLVDDVLDYEGDPRATGKALKGDLRDGKLTLPLILALEADRSLLPEVHAVRDGDPVAAERLIATVNLQRTCDAVRAIAAEETRLALEALGELPRSAARELLASVAYDLASRAA